MISAADLAAVGSGGLVGLMLGLIGGGGSILATPLLLYVVGVADPHVAIGTGALAVSANAYANLISHARKGHVWWRCAVVFALVGSLGAAMGSSLGMLIDGKRLLFLSWNAALDKAVRAQELAQPHIQRPRPLGRGLCDISQPALLKDCAPARGPDGRTGAPIHSGRPCTSDLALI